jgi:PhzF family phenazine biosynthesis protein
MLYRLCAFTIDPEGGNPAGVWIGDELPAVEEMQKIAAEVGFSETAFVAPATGFDRTIRYYSPEVEVPFCGHATIATGVVLGRERGSGTYNLSTSVGIVPVDVIQEGNYYRAALTSVEPKQTEVSAGSLAEILAAIAWQQDELDRSIPPMKAYAGSWHLILAVAERERLERLDYDFDTLKKIMLRDNLTTLQLVWRDRDTLFHARNPFPVGGVVEDPATGSAAAALGGYLRAANLIKTPAKITIYQGESISRPSQLTVEIPPSGGIIVSGNAVWL